jgi:hypothetical protein
MRAGFRWGNLKKRDHLEDLRHILVDNIKTDPEQVGWEHGLASYCSGQGQIAGLCESGNDLRAPMKCYEFSD